MSSLENIPGVRELFTADAFAQISGDREICGRIHLLHDKEQELAGILEGIDSLKMHRACQARIMQPLGDETAGEIQLAPDDPDAFVRRISDLPRLPCTADKRRRARELARGYLNICKGSLFVPKDAEGFRELWTLAQEELLC